MDALFSKREAARGVDYRPTRRFGILAVATVSLIVGGTLVARSGAANAGTPFEADPRALDLVQRFERACADLRTATYRLHKVERLRDGEVVVEEVDVRLRRKPAAFYLAAVKPRRGQEVIYDEARDARQLTAHPGHFPDVTVRLSIYGSLATARQHHPVTCSGFDYLLHTVTREIAEARRAPAGERMTYLGERTVGGRATEVVLLTAGNRSDRRVAAQAGETLFRFAERVGSIHIASSTATTASTGSATSSTESNT